MLQIIEYKNKILGISLKGDNGELTQFSYKDKANELLHRLNIQ